MTPNTRTAFAHTLKWSGRTDQGKVRTNNEDSFLGLQFDAHEVHRLGKYGEASTLSADFAFAVSDGMGGALAGEYASRVAVEKITTLLPRSFHAVDAQQEPQFAAIMTELFSKVHRALKFLGDSYSECNSMETTLSLCWFTPKWMYFGHIGDSRIYHLPAGQDTIVQLSHDDTHVGWLLRNGKLTEHQARSHPRRNVLQKALGGGNQFVDPQVGAINYNAGDIFLLCTDGLVDGLFNHQFVELLRSPAAQSSPAGPATFLVDASLTNSGRDNTTALIIQVV